MALAPDDIALDQAGHHTVGSTFRTDAIERLEVPAASAYRKRPMSKHRRASRVAIRVAVRPLVDGLQIAARLWPTGRNNGPANGVQEALRR